MNHRFRQPVGVASLLALCCGGAAAQSFAIEGAVLDSRTSQNLGVASEHGQINEFFKAQKAMTFGILRAAGISLDQLSPEVRARIERFQTTNLDAFRAFSQGLDLKDQGRYQEAKEAFRRAAELDPGFALAAEQAQAMPDVTVGSALQMRAVIAAASTTAVDRGKASYAVDIGRAVAALTSGQSVAVVSTPPAESPDKTVQAADYSVNAPGSVQQNLPNLAAGIAYPVTSGGLSVNLAFSNEYRGDQYATSGGAAADVLEVLQSTDNTGATFRAARNGAAVTNAGSTTLTDGTRVSWGTWNSAPGTAAAVTLNGQAQTAPVPGPIDFVIGAATLQMPGTGSATFSPAGGSLGAATGTISVNFGTRNIGLNDLGFTLGGFTFSGLTGNATYGTQVASGGFSGNYTGGNCAGCSSFNPQQGAFSGNFVGRDANGLIFSTLLPTGSGFVSGVHLFGHSGP